MRGIPQVIDSRNGLPVTTECASVSPKSLVHHITGGRQVNSTKPQPATKPQADRTYLTIAQATERSSLSRSTLYLLMNSNQLEYTKVGRARRIPLDALMKV